MSESAIISNLICNLSSALVFSKALDIIRLDVMAYLDPDYNSGLFVCLFHILGFRPKGHHAYPQGDSCSDLRVPQKTEKLFLEDFRI